MEKWQEIPLDNEGNGDFGCEDCQLIQVMDVNGAPETENTYFNRCALHSAAPDLLAALEDAKRGDCWCGLGIGDPRLSAHSKACDAARAASAKAKAS